MAESSGNLNWRRAKACGTSACVEVALTADTVHVRDASDPGGACLRFSPADWRAFVAVISGR